MSPETEIGPLVSERARRRVEDVVGRAVAAGARVVAGGRAPTDRERGAWFLPTLLADVSPQDEIAQRETFGPVAVLLPFDTVDEAVALANGVEQGLVGAISTRDPRRRDAVAAALEVGIVNLTPGPLPVDPEAPFGGMKASRIGPPEHGRFDLAFYARHQAIYGEGTS
jgi:succinate-semialdehyde dehydrogenase/glutarate-semialdehyde dehydrogenase